MAKKGNQKQKDKEKPQEGEDQQDHDNNPEGMENAQNEVPVPITYAVATVRRRNARMTPVNTYLIVEQRPHETSWFYRPDYNVRVELTPDQIVEVNHQWYKGPRSIHVARHVGHSINYPDSDLFHMVSKEFEKTLFLSVLYY